MCCGWDLFREKQRACGLQRETASAGQRCRRTAYSGSEDVHCVPGHIACDAASRSEIVLPLHKNGEVIGVLDIDSPEVGRFSAEDEEGLREVVRILERIIVCS